MITKSIIEVKYIDDGVYLSAKTDKGEYGQHYNMLDKTKPSFVIDVDTAKEQFVAFYNQYE